MPKDDMETECMNELFGKSEQVKDDDVGYYNHWRPVALYHPDGTKIRDLTKAEQIAWIKQQKDKER